MYNYKIYGYGLHGYELVDVITDETKLKDYMGLVEYSRILVIKHNIKLDQDEPIILEEVKGNIKKYEIKKKN